LINPLAEKGRYTVVFPALAAPNNGLASEAYPQGDGYGVLTLSRTKGEARMVGKLADDTTVKLGGQLSATNILPVYSELYNGTGLIIGEVKFDPSNAATDAAGTLRWYRPSNVARQTLYAEGWPSGIDVDFIASKFVLPVPPTAKNPVNTGTVLGPTVLPVTASPTPNVTISLQDGGIETPTLNEGRLSQKGQLVVLAAPSGGANDLLAKFKGSFGLLSGSFTHPDTGKAVAFKGVPFQKGGFAAGYFIYKPAALSSDVPASGGVLIQKYTPPQF
jgi:hypothetical protein